MVSGGNGEIVGLASGVELEAHPERMRASAVTQLVQGNLNVRDRAGMGMESDSSSNGKVYALF
jgi:hypothetical protein